MRVGQKAAKVLGRANFHLIQTNEGPTLPSWWAEASVFPLSQRKDAAQLAKGHAIGWLGVSVEVGV